VFTLEFTEYVRDAKIASASTCRCPDDCKWCRIADNIAAFLLRKVEKSWNWHGEVAASCGASWPSLLRQKCVSGSRDVGQTFSRRRWQTALNRAASQRCLRR